MDIKGMSPRYDYTDSNYGIKINDYLNFRNTIKEEYNTKFTLPKKDTFYSNEKFLQVPFFRTGNEVYNGLYPSYNNVSRPKEPVNKTSDIEGINNIDFRTNSWVELGKYNDITIKFKMNSNGQNIDSNLAATGESSNELRKIAEMTSHLTDAQLEEINGIKAAFEKFCEVAADGSSVLSIDKETNDNLILGLEKMGVDLSKPFAINGEEFYLRNDTGKVDYYNLKKYVVNDNGNVEIQDAANDQPSDVWKEISEKYDVNNASFEDIKEIAKKLCNAGQITVFQYAMMTFNPNESQSSLKTNYFLTPTNEAGNRDWIKEFEARAEKNLQQGNNIAYTTSKDIVGILEKLKQI